MRKYVRVALASAFLSGSAMAQTPADFAITSPLPNAHVATTFTVMGTVGSKWVNLAAWTTVAPYIGLAVDVAPAGGAFTMNIDSTKLPEGPVNLKFTAYSVPPGQSGDSLDILFPIVVNNTLTFAATLESLAPMQCSPEPLPRPETPTVFRLNCLSASAITSTAPLTPAQLLQIQQGP